MERLTKRINLGNGRYTIDFSNERCGEFLTDHKSGVRALFEKLAAYEDAEEQGLLIRLPCRVGSKCYAVHKTCSDDGYEKKGEYFPSASTCMYYCDAKECDAEYCICESGLYSIQSVLMNEKYIGKSIFLTREEAEKALAEMEK